MHKVKKAKAAPAAPKTVAKKIVMPAAEAGKKQVLNIINSGVKLPATYNPKQWQEITASKEVAGAHLPISINELAALPDGCVDSIFNMGSLSYLYAHEVLPTLQHCYRILRYGGTLSLSVSDLQKIGQILAQGKPERELYRAPAGGISAIDLLYGHRNSIINGRTDLQIKTGFTASSIAHKLTPLGFGEVDVRREAWMMHVLARKIDANPKDKPIIRLHEDDLNEMMKKRENIIRNPEWIKITPENGV